MKKTNKEVLDFFGLKVGDRVKILNCDFCDYFVIKKGKDGFEYVESVHSYRPCNTWYLQTLASILLKYEYEVITSKKKLGEIKCEGMLCKDCPLRAIYCDIDSSTLYEALENYKKYLNSFNGSLKPFEKTFIDAIKAELDKEVEECEK